MLNKLDFEQLAVKGISEAELNSQLESFRSGFPFLVIVDSASVGKGITAVPQEDQAEYIRIWDEYLAESHRVIKFVPASGAASRMFKDLYAFLDAGYDEPVKEAEKTFFEKITSFAFYKTLNDKCLQSEGKTIEELVEGKKFKTIVGHLLSKTGLNYGNLPKGLLLFHRYESNGNQPRTAFEEHLAEGAMYAGGSNGEVSIHFTVLPEHEQLFRQLAEEKKAEYENMYSVTYNLSYNCQKTSTDTVAVDISNEPFRDREGRIVFRPGGHGALIENLNDMDADVIFIKNVDNVTPDNLRQPTIVYKKLIAGILVSVQRRIFEYLKTIESGQYTHDQIEEMIHFLHDTLYIRNSDMKNLEDADLVIYIKSKLNRPIRVCGMVRNFGEPGGGPFIVVNPDDTTSPQILESSQIDLSREDMKALFDRGTHFNPVDLVCATKDYKGRKYNLPEHVDKNAGFISSKSKDGRELKALELPGLWNGAMSDWNTIFVEVPITTFNPVKTVLDLLRPEHQG